MLDDVDWSQRADCIEAKHGVTVTEANDALADPSRLVFDPIRRAGAATASESSDGPRRSAASSP
jgi:hypothetical protein